MSEIRDMTTLLEHVDGQYKALQEGFDSLRHVPASLRRLEEKVDGINMRLRSIESIVKEHHVIFRSQGLVE